MNLGGMQKHELTSMSKVGIAGVIHTVLPKGGEKLLLSLIASVLEQLETVAWSLIRSEH